MVFPTCRKNWLSLGEQPGSNIIISSERCHIWLRHPQETASARSPGLLCFYTLPHTVWDYFPQYLRWLKPCFMCTNVFPGLLLPAIINREGAGCFELKTWHGYQPSLHLAWLVDVVWIVSGLGFLKVIAMYAAPVEWLLHSVLSAAMLCHWRTYKYSL